MSGYVTVTVTVSDTEPSVVESVKTNTVPNLEALQSVVGGLIEPMFTVPSPVRKNIELTAYVNEEGLCIGLPVRAAVVDSYGVRPFAGSMIIVGLDSEGDTVLLDDSEIAFLELNILARATPLFDYGIMVEAVIYPEGK